VLKHTRPLQHEARLTKRQVDDNVIEAEVRRKIALSVGEVRRGHSLAVKLCVSDELNNGSKRITHWLVSTVDAPQVTSGGAHGSDLSQNQTLI
jgi:hypothetical protein